MTIIDEKYLNKISKFSGRRAFRGQANGEWKLHSAATRRLIKQLDDENITKKTGFAQIYTSYHRDVLIEQARTNGFGIDDGYRISDLQLLAKLQHFGAATGLLDFTWDPLVALWFTCEKDDCDGKVFVINLNDPKTFQRVSSEASEKNVEEIFSPRDISPKPLYWEPMIRGDATPRVLRQRSVFVIGRPLVPKDVIEYIEISALDKAQIRNELEDIFDVGEETLFTDIHGFSVAHGAESPLRQIEDPYYYLFQGNQFYQQGDYPAAIASYDRCIDLASDVSETYFLRGNAKAEIRDYERAKQDYDLAVYYKSRPYLSINSNLAHKTVFNPIIFQPLYFNRGNVKSKLNDYEGALADYDEALRVGGEDYSELFYNRANVKAMLYRFEDAIDDYNEAIRRSPHHLHARFNKGNALIILGRFDEAIRCYDEEIIKERAADSGVVKNRDSVRMVLDRIDGAKYESHFSEDEISAGKASVKVSVQISDDNVETNLFRFQGNTGNTGNSGGNRLPGGKGFHGSAGFVVEVAGRKS